MKPTESARNVVDGGRYNVLRQRERRVDAICMCACNAPGTCAAAMCIYIFVVDASTTTDRGSSGMLETSLRTARRCKQLNIFCYQSHERHGTVRTPKSAQHVFRSAKKRKTPSSSSCTSYALPSGVPAYRAISASSNTREEYRTPSLALEPGQTRLSVLPIAFSEQLSKAHVWLAALPLLRAFGCRTG